jgi:uncharacterized protein (DUF2336 family)
MPKTLQAACSFELPVGSRPRTERAQLLRSVTDLFMSGAGRHSDAQIELFDDILCRLVQHVETAAVACLSADLAPIDTAPPRVVGMLARHDDIAIAGPLLRRSTRLQTEDLVEIASTQSQAHLLAIGSRSGIAEAVTEVLAERGDIEVAKAIAANRDARLSAEGVAHLAARAEHEHGLAELLGRRVELYQMRQLALRAADAVRHHLIALARAERRANVERLPCDLSADIEWPEGMERRDYSAARRAVDGMQQDPALIRTALASAAKGHAFEMTVVLLAALARTGTRSVERVMAGRDIGGILLLCKAIELEWSTVRAILALHRCGETASAADLDRWRGQFSRIDAALAERVVQFWQARGTLAACAITARSSFATPYRDGENDRINWTLH